jgi:hypothetical protein
MAQTFRVRWSSRDRHWHVENNSSAVTALVCGVLAFAMPFSAALTASLAILFGITGRSRARRGAPHGRLATVGLVLGISAWTLISVLLLALVLFG